MRFHSLFQRLADNLVKSRAFLQVAVDKVRQQCRKIVRKAHLFVAIRIHSSHYRIDVVVADEDGLGGRGCLASAVSCHYTSQLLSRQFTSTAHVQRLEKLRDLQVECLVALSLVELRDLPLNLLHDLDLALEKFRQ